MKRLLHIMALIIVAPTLALVTGCGGGMSAPPVSIPTPVTGRIVVGSPDADGNIAIVGENGAVDAGEIVMAINVTEAESALYEKVIEFFVGTAYATLSSNLPAVCSGDDWHGCDTADENGAFSITIKGAEGDEIAIVLIDITTGEEKGDRIRKTVPAGLFGFGLPVVDVGVKPDTGGLYVLLKGGTNTSGEAVNNTIVVFDPDTKSSVETVEMSGGENAADLLVGENYIAVVDIQNSAAVLYVAEMGNDGSFTPDDFSALTLFSQSSLSYSDYLDNTFAVLNGTANHLYSFNGADHGAFSAIDLGSQWAVFEKSGGIDDITGSVLVHSNAVALGSMTIDGSDTGLVAFLANLRIPSGSNSNTLTERSFIVVFDESDIISWVYNQRLSQNHAFVPKAIGDPGVDVDPFIWTILPEGTDASDIRFLDGQGNIMVTDKGNDAVHIYTISLNESSADSHVYGFDSDKTSITDSRMTSPLEIEAVNGYAFVTADNGTDERSDSVFTIDLSTNKVINMLSVGFLPSGLAYDGANQKLFVSGYISRSLKGIPLDELTTPE